MNFAAVTPSVSMRSLPPLSGRLLAAYRAIWILLALGSVSVLASMALSPVMDPVILALRLGKGAVLLAVSAILFRRRQQDIVAALLSSAFLLWTMTSSYDVTGGQAPLAAALADRLRFLLFALALLLFPGGRWCPAWTRHVAAASAVVFLLGVAETLGLIRTGIFLPLAILCVLASIAALLSRFRSAPSQVERQQLKWIALGLAVGILFILLARGGAALDAYMVGPAFARPVLEALFQLGVIAIAIGFLVSLLRYRLYDAEAVISRSAAYAGLTLARVATFAGSEALIEMFGQQYFGSGLGNVSAAMGAAVAAVLLSPLHGRITGWAERRFQRDLAVLKEQLPELLAELSGISSTARVGRMALPHIEGALHANQSALVVDGRIVATGGIDKRSAERWARNWLPLDSPHMFDRDASSEFPLRMPLRCPFGTLRGWLLLGARPDGSPFGRDDLEALAAVRPALRTALIAAREREKEREREAAAQRSTRRRLLDLVARVSALEEAQGTAMGGLTAPSRK